jgi:hypothetical protein
MSGHRETQLFHAPDGKARAFSEWAPYRLAELAGLKDPVADAVFFTPGTKRDGFSPHVARFKKNEVERCWAYFRYLIKNLDPDLAKEEKALGLPPCATMAVRNLRCGDRNGFLASWPRPLRGGRWDYPVPVISITSAA